jgi:phage gp36-like protein
VLASTDAVIDAALAVRYRLPLGATPPIVADLAAAIAIYKLHRSSPEQKIKDDYDQALKDLAAIGKGTLRLDLAGNEPAGSGGGGVIATDRPRDFSPDNLRGFI